MRRIGTTLAIGALLLAGIGCFASPAKATTIDGQFDRTGPVGPGATFNLTVAGRGGVPASGVGSVALNVTATNPTSNGYFTVWPTGQPRPNASNLNFVAGQTIPNMVIVPIGAGGQISIFNETGNTDAIVDVLGWFPTGPSFTGLTPARVLDSRPATTTIDGNFRSTGPIPGGNSINLSVAGRGGVPASGVGSVALNVTATNPTSNGYFTVWPTGQPRPNASNLNFVAGQTIPNMVIVPIGAGGQISIFNETGNTDAIVDVLGWFPTGPSFTGLTPARLLDSRPATTTIDGNFRSTGPIPGGNSINLSVAGRGGVPASGVGSVALNVTATNPTSNGYFTVWPTGQPRPNASNLNFVAGQTIPNMVIVPIGAGGQISIFNETGNTDAIVDVLGWFPTGPSFTGLTPARLLDSRVPPPPSPPPPPVELAFSAGTHLVNVSIPPGRYFAVNAQSGCYWERLRGLGGTSSEIIANDFRGYTGRVIVDIVATDVAFKFDADCGQFKSVQPPVFPASAIGPGTHVVGSNIVSGTYSTSASSGCYWERVRSFDGQSTSIIANDFVSTAGAQFVTISATDVGFTSDDDCGVWTKVG